MKYRNARCYQIQARKLENHRRWAIGLHLPLLTRNQENELSARVARGDEEAVRLLVLHNIRYVIYAVWRYLPITGPAIDVDDLVQEGYLGLLEAIPLYHSNMASFIAFAKHYIRRNILQTLRDAFNQISVPSDLIRAIRRPNEIKLRKDRYTQSSIRSAQQAMRLQRWTICQFDSLPTSADFDLIDDELDRQVIGEQLHRALGHIRERDAAAIVLRFGLGGEPPLTLRQIGPILGVTGERVRTLSDRGIRDLGRRLGRVRKMLCLPAE
jgi:RNA polymerase primary sigma factor